MSDQVCSSVALVVDLDGTLCRSDTLHEALIAYSVKSPGSILSIGRWLSAGKAQFKARLADRWIVDPATLPINERVFALVAEARAAGRRTLLVSAADQRQVDAIAAHVGLFDEAVGTGSGIMDGQNLSGRVKADYLVARFGERGFDYVGDSTVDLPVWERARRAITVRAGSGLRAASERINGQTSHLDPKGSWAEQVQPYLKALRPHQWTKNLLVLLPALAAHDATGLGPALVAFIAFSLTASSVYLINDLVDLEADRIHPRKRLRPFAQASASIANGFILALLLAIIAFGLAIAFTPTLFLGTLLLYYVTTFAYSLYLKRKLIVDVLTLAALYSVRILAGAVAASVVLSPWMLGFSMFLFLSLAAVKRQAELTDQLRDGRSKVAGRAYQTDDLPVLRGIALSAGYAAVLVFALYISSPGVLALYSSPDLLWLVCPLLLYWVSRMVMMTHRGYMSDDPIVYAAQDRISQAVVALSGVIVVLAAVL